MIPVSECDMKLTTRDKGILSAVGFAGRLLKKKKKKNKSIKLIKQY